MSEKHQGLSQEAINERREYREVLASARAEEIEKDKKRFFCSKDKDWQNQIGRDLMEWAETDEARLLDSFPLKRGYSPRRFYKMAESNEFFAECLEYAKARLGEKIEGKLKDNSVYLFKALPLYSTLWEDQEERKRKDDSKFVHVYKEVQVEIPVIGKKDE
jgi:hypothetical protein